ncbi:MAG: hypothetical protein RIG84_09820 [Roseovarius sp.]
MSDPVKNVEIEDVLSSIRRLVSSEERARDDDARPDEAPTEASFTVNRAAREDKLVLTPAQRVDSSPRAAFVAAQDADTAEPLDDALLEETLAEAIEETFDEDAPESAASTLEDDLYGDIEDAEIVEDAETGAFDDIDSDEISDEAREDVLEDPSTEPLEVPEFLTRRRMDADGPQPAEASDLANGIGTDDSDEDAGEDLAEAHFAENAFFAEDEAEPVEPDTAEMHAGEAAEPLENEAEALDLDDLAARIAGVEKAVASQEGAWEPDGNAEDDNAAQDPVSPLPWAELDESDQEEHEPETRAESTNPEAGQDEATPAEGEAAARTRSDWFDEDAVLEEEALRDMVSEIVRQELQGALGERITRNVRKLVRREINRALLGQGMD